MLARSSRCPVIKPVRGCSQCQVGPRELVDLTADGSVQGIFDVGRRFLATGKSTNQELNCSSASRAAQLRSVQIVLQTNTDKVTMRDDQWPEGIAVGSLTRT